MGDPGKLRKKFSMPSHPWQKMRIDEEKELNNEYHFKNKRELWKLNSILRNFKRQVKDLVPRRDETAERQKKEFLTKMRNLNLVGSDSILEDVLSLTLKDMCERRLQTLVVRKGLARSMKQARQFIVHGHVAIGEDKITSPSYLVSAKEQSLIRFSNSSDLSDESHPERIPVGTVVHKPEVKEQKPKKEEKKTEPKKEEVKEEKVEEKPETVEKEDKKEEVKEEGKKPEEVKEEIKEQPKEDIKEENKEDKK